MRLAMTVQQTSQRNKNKKPFHYQSLIAERLFCVSGSLPAKSGILPAIHEVLPAKFVVLPAIREVLPAKSSVLPAIHDTLPAKTIFY